MGGATRWVRQVRFVVAGVLLAGLLAAWPLAPAPVGAVSTTLVISQVYGGGGNGGATYKNDFIEIFNVSSSTINLSAYSVQAYQGNGTAYGAAQTLSGMLAPGQYYLIQEGAGSNMAAAGLPTPDLIPASPYGMSATSASAQLFMGATLIDTVGYGTATLKEGSAVASLGNNMAARRTASCTDTDNNFADFTIVSLDQTTNVPRNNATPLAPCVAGPAISTVSPSSGPANGGTVVTITGTNTNFVNGTTTVTFNGIMATGVTVTNATTLTATTPANTGNAAGSVDVIVTTGAETATKTMGFTYTIPAITSIAPASGSIAGGTAVTITGTNFSTAGSTTVSIGGTPATGVTVVNAMTITATTPAGMAGAAAVGVVNNGVTATGSVSFTYTNSPVPTITAVRPNYGPLAGGGTVTITGTNFAADATVSFGATAGTGVMVNMAGTQITVTAPAGSAGAVNVVVTNPTTMVSGTATNAFTYIASGTTRIHDIQGAAHRSPLEGTSVAAVQGIVTAKASNGFYLEDDDAYWDSNVGTSEGIFVFGSTAAGMVTVGNVILLGGSVSEFRSSSSSSINLIRLTEITSPTVSVVVASAPLPSAIIVGMGGRQIPGVYSSPCTGTCNLDDAPATSGLTYDATLYSVDFFESLEGMRAQVNDAKIVGPGNSFNEIPVVTDNAAQFAGKTTPRGGVYITNTRDNPQRFYLQNCAGTNFPNPNVNVGDSFAGATVGVFTYGFHNYTLCVTSVGTYTSGGIMRETTALVGDTTHLTLGNLNVQNLAPSDPQSKFDRLGGYVKNNLQSPDILTIQEIQDNTGATDDGVVAADMTWGKLIAAITAAGGPTYTYRQIDPVNDQDGGQPGGNIRQGFLFNAARVTFVDRAGGTSTTANSVVTDGTGTHLQYSPGRIDPSNSAWNSSRKPLAGEFTFNGNRFFVVANHFNSKGGDTGLYDKFQPPTRSSEVQRAQQAQIVHDFVQSLLTADPTAKAVVAGDLNDFQFSNTLNILRTGTAAGTGTAILEDLVSRLPANEQYTYVYEGNSQVLDHILVSTTLSSALGSTDYDVVHLNSEFYDQASDHEPEVARINLPTPPMPTQVTYTFTGPNNGNTGPQSFDVTAKVTPGSDITAQTFLRYKATLTRNGSPVVGLVVNYSAPGDMGMFTTDMNGMALFGPVTGFRYGDVPNLTTTGATTSFSATVLPPGDYVLSVQLLKVADSTNVGAAGTKSFTLVAPDLTLTKTDGNLAFNVGLVGTYTVTVTNSNAAGTGPTIMGDTITVTDILPNGLIYVATGSGGTNWSCMVSGQTVTCTYSGTLAAGASSDPLTLKVQVGAAAFPSVMNTATVTTPRDVNSANNAGSDTTTVVAPDLIIGKSHTGNFTVGQNSTYTLLIENGGTGRNQSPITVTDTLPSGLTFVSNSGSWMCMASGQTVTCTDPIQLYEAGSPFMLRTASFTITVAVSPTIIPVGMNTATVTNMASVSTPNESNTTNNNASDMTTVEFPAPTVTMIAPNHGPTAGGTTVTITGTGFRTGATVTFGGTAATMVTVVNATTITAVSPAHGPGPFPVIVTNADGKLSGGQANGFVYEQPAIGPAQPTRQAGTPVPTQTVPAPAPTPRPAGTPVPTQTVPAPPTRR